MLTLHALVLASCADRQVKIFVPRRLSRSTCCSQLFPGSSALCHLYSWSLICCSLSSLCSSGSVPHCYCFCSLMNCSQSCSCLCASIAVLYSKPGLYGPRGYSGHNTKRITNGRCPAQIAPRTQSHLTHSFCKTQHPNG